MRGFDGGEPDQRRLVLVGVEDVDAAVRRRRCGWSRRRAGRRAPRRPGRWWAPSTPRRGDDLQAGAHLVHAGPVEHRDVVRAFGGEQRAGVHRRRVERIVVAGQQVDRNADGPHGLQRLADDPRRELVVLEHVAGHHDELGAGLGGQRAQAGDRVAAGGRIPRLRLAVEEVAGHPELPVGGVHEAHLGPSFPAASLLGVASVGRARRQVPGPASAWPYGELGDRPLPHPAVASAREVGLSGGSGRPRAAAGPARRTGGRAGGRLVCAHTAPPSTRCCARRRPGPARPWRDRDRGAGELRRPAVRRHARRGDRRDQRRRPRRGDPAGDRPRAGDVIGWRSAWRLPTAATALRPNTSRRSSRPRRSPCCAPRSRGTN